MVENFCISKPKKRDSKQLNWSLQVNPKKFLRGFPAFSKYDARQEQCCQIHCCKKGQQQTARCLSWFAKFANSGPQANN